MRKNKSINWLLYPFALFYRLAVAFRNWMFDLKILSSKEFDIPIISVGNITVGGTGKTPHIEYLVSLFRKDFKIAVLSRGYRRKTKGFVMATENSTADDIGDEPKQIKQKFQEITVAVDANRVKGIRRLLFETECDIILLDDAFQHRYVEPGLSILLIDYHRPLNEDYMLPLGELRENASEHHRANIIIITKTPAEIKPIEQRIIEKNLSMLPYQTLFFTTLKYGFLTPVYRDFKVSNDRMDNLCKSQNYSFLVVTGIASPEPLLEYLAELTQEIVHLCFADHHYFLKKDIQLIIKKFESIENKNKIVITTEKDSVRLRNAELFEDNFKMNVYYVPIEIGFIADGKELFDKEMMRFITKDKWSKKPYPKRN